MTRSTKSKTRRAVATTVLALAALSLVPLAAHAAGRGGRDRPDPDRAVARLTEKLELTAEQQARVKDILAASFAEGATLRQEHLREMKAHRDEAHERLAAALTPDQAAKLDHLRAERQERQERRKCRQDCDQGGAATD